VESTLLTPKEVAGRLRVTDGTVKNLIHRGELRAVRVGAKLLRVDSRALDEYLAARTLDERGEEKSHG
jgi:excisionase family DNA binding protein